jgi:hypothetical protein
MTEIRCFWTPTIGEVQRFANRQKVPQVPWFHCSVPLCRKGMELKEYSIGRPKDRRQHLLQLTALSPLMKEQLLKFRTNLVLGLPAAFGLGISSPAVRAQEKGSALKAWAAIQPALDGS